MSSFQKKMKNSEFRHYFDFVFAFDLCYTVNIPTGNISLGGAPQNEVVLCGKNKKWRKIAMPMAIVWLVAIVLAIIIEALTNQLVSCAAMAAMPLVCFGYRGDIVGNEAPVQEITSF